MCQLHAVHSHRRRELSYPSLSDHRLSIPSSFPGPSDNCFTTSSSSTSHSCRSRSAPETTMSFFPSSDDDDHFSFVHLIHPLHHESFPPSLGSGRSSCPHSCLLSSLVYPCRHPSSAALSLFQWNKPKSSLPGSAVDPLPASTSTAFSFSVRNLLSCFDSSSALFIFVGFESEARGSSETVTSASPTNPHESKN